MKGEAMNRTIKHCLTVAALMLVCAVARGAVIVERVSGGNNGVHAYLAKVAPEPVRGGAIVQPETGVTIRRLTDVALTTSPLSGNPKGWDGVTYAGLTNGYSRRQNVNITEQYALAFLVTPAAYLIRLSDLKPLGIVISKNGTKLGDSNELKWHKDPVRETWITYCIGPNIYEQDALVGPASEKLICALGGNVNATDDGDISADGRYEAQSLTNGRIVVIDLLKRQLLPGFAKQSTVGVDVSPDGKWVRGASAYYAMADFIAGTTATQITGPSGHGGWCAMPDGTNVFVQQDNSNDWLVAFDPVTRKSLYLMRMPEIGGGNFSVGVHVAGDRMQRARGWALVSVYGTSAPLAYNVFWIELKSCKAAGATNTAPNLPADQLPRIVRVCDMQHKYTGSYFTEGWASISPSARAVLWGGNWNATDNLELYRAEIPHDILEYIGVESAAPEPIQQTKTVTLYAGAVINGKPYPIGPTGFQGNYFNTGSDSFGQTTRGNYQVLCSFDPLLKVAPFYDTGVMYYFNLQGIVPKGARILSARFGVSADEPKTEYGNHPTGRERVPVCPILNPKKLPGVWQAAYLKDPNGGTAESNWNGASWRLWSESPVLRWSDAPSKSTVPKGQAGDLSTVLGAPVSTISFSADPTKLSWTGDLAPMVQAWADGANYGFALDAQHCESPDRFGPGSGVNALKFRMRAGVRTGYCEDVAKRPRLEITYQ